MSEMNLFCYEQVKELESFGFGKLRDSEFSNIHRSVYAIIDRTKLFAYGLPVRSEEEPDVPVDGENFIVDYNTAITAIEKLFVATASSIETPIIHQLLADINDSMIGINAAVSGSAKLKIEPNHSAGVALAGLVHNFVKIKSLPTLQLLEEGDSVCDELLSKKNLPHLSAIALVSAVKNVQTLINDAKDHYYARANDKTYAETDEHREYCLTLYKYLNAKVLAQANGVSPSPFAIDFIKRHNSIIKEAQITYNQRMGQLHRKHEEEVITETKEVITEVMKGISE